MKQLFLLLFLVCSCISASAQEWNQYDANHDGDVDVTDITAIALEILSGNNNMPKMHNGHEYVDLGLPSGLKWATCNVDALSPEDCGGYYAWGETEEKAENLYTWDTWKWVILNEQGFIVSQIKYNSDPSRGPVDNKIVLDPEDDVASVKWGGRWRMPTIYEFGELWGLFSWATKNGMPGQEVRGHNGKTIFIPAAGQISSINAVTRLNSVGDDGYYWCSSKFLDGEGKDRARVGNFGINFNTAYGCEGFTVRPVCDVPGSSYDTNRDGVVDIADITAVANHILNENNH